MALVAVRNKFLVVIPGKMRERIRLRVDDLLEAGAERGKITSLECAPINSATCSRAV